MARGGESCHLYHGEGVCHQVSTPTTAERRPLAPCCRRTCWSVRRCPLSSATRTCNYQSNNSNASATCVRGNRLRPLKCLLRGTENGCESRRNTFVGQQRSLRAGNKTYLSTPAAKCHRHYIAQHQTGRSVDLRRRKVYTRCRFPGQKQWEVSVSVCKPTVPCASPKLSGRCPAQRITSSRCSSRVVHSILTVTPSLK